MKSSDAQPVVGTPVGDNEKPLQPSSHAALTGLQDPRGSKPSAYKRDKK